ncbi:nucleolin-like [Coffea eugenioides]|uniref:nucleolin-like n=1 Tax=Coffea eugenioides TaxID=49369 RepID=UPI000F6047C8|nr:nucleolin-like [Coffea eugenioides]
MVRIRGGSVSARRTFMLRDEEDEYVQIVEPTIKSPKKKIGNRGGKMKQSARKKHNVPTRKPSAELSDEQMEEHQFEGYPVSDNEEEPVQPTNADVTNAEKIAEKPSTRRSPRTRSGVQSATQTAQHSEKRKCSEQPETETAAEPTSLPKFIDDEARERKGRSHIDFISRVNSVNIELNPDIVNSVLETKIENGFKAIFVAKRNLLVPPENKNTHRKEPRTEPTTEPTPEYRASSSQPQDKGKAPATEEETEEEDDDDEDEDTEEEDSAQFRLVRRRSGSSKITF